MIRVGFDTNGHPLHVGDTVLCISGAAEGQIGVIYGPCSKDSVYATHLNGYFVLHVKHPDGKYRSFNKFGSYCQLKDSDFAMDVGL